MSVTSDDSRAVWERVRQINEAWVNGRAADLAQHFREDMVIVAPGFAQRLEGREACVESYADFLARAAILDFKESEPSVDIHGDTAVVDYRYDIEYEMGDERNVEAGRDLLVLVRDEGEWRVAWRTILPIGDETS